MFLQYNVEISFKKKICCNLHFLKKNVTNKKLVVLVEEGLEEVREGDEKGEEDGEEVEEGVPGQDYSLHPSWQPADKGTAHKEAAHKGVAHNGAADKGRPVNTGQSYQKVRTTRRKHFLLKSTVLQFGSTRY